ncbi:TIM barrel protein [Gracilibacillus sp. YIM 98692]|uniref:sugar phosphate isomerase/epimerase family protein n=1 Tax=Gracilibacillus sp. YIM 98692 TaxID=2663532 RepID=UPI0013D0DB82|nr:TIM barrel protein [Gracilibacillus sp. YIM 98692]
MKLGLCSVTFRSKSIEQVIDLAMEAELDAIEWGGDVHVPPGDIDHAKNVLEMTKSRELEVSSYGSYYRVGDPEKNEHSFETILETAQALHTTSIRVWAGTLDSEDADKSYRQSVIEDAKRIADMAGKENISIHFEYHGGTLTNTKESAKQLMEEVDHGNVYLYWQPAVGLSVEDRLASIDLVKPWISNVHIFHWNQTERLDLGIGAKEWQRYLKEIMSDQKERYVLMEFVKNDDVQQFRKDALVLHELKKIIDGTNL